MLRFSAKTAVALMASGSLGLSASALAQTPPTQPAPPTATPAPTMQAEDVDDRQIRSFALALVEVDKIQRQYMPRVEAAGADERPALEQEAGAKMTAAVQAQGLDPETFHQISAAAKDDPQLTGKIREELTKLEPAAPAAQ